MYSILMLQNHLLPQPNGRDVPVLGPPMLTITIAAFGLQWLASLPGPSDRAVYLGQALGSMSLVMMSLALALVSIGPQLEGLFSGLDKVMMWHKRIAVAGAALILPHIPLATTGDNRGTLSPLAVASAVALSLMTLWALGPSIRARMRTGRNPDPAPLRGSRARFARVRSLIAPRLADYDYWRLFHRTSVAVIVMGAIHGATDSTLASLPVLRSSHLGVAILGLAAYAYYETLGRARQPRYEYDVSDIATTGSGVTELKLAPVGPRLRFTPGQFAFLSFPGGIEARRHPFTITSSPHEPGLRFSVKALGDFTAQLPYSVHPGTAVTVHGPFGRMDHTQGSITQVWVAGGVGVTPFMSWLRSLDQIPITGAVHFFYSVRSRHGDPFIDEIEQITAAHPEIITRIVATEDRPHLTPQEIVSAVGDLRATTVYMAGPRNMQKALRPGLIHAGLHRSRFHTEHFSWR